MTSVGTESIKLEVSREVSMGEVQLTVVARTDVGRVRDNNEDAFVISDLDTGESLTPPVKNLDVSDRGILAVVSDGMGGHAAGEVASSLVVDSLRKALSDPSADHSSLQRLIDHAVRRANTDVWKAASGSRRKGMGATLTALLVHDADGYLAEVGDSRAYLLRADRLRQVTKDQSFVQMLLDAGALTPQEAKEAPQRNVVLQAMGLEKTVLVSIGKLSLRRGDRFLLCSDGLYNMVSDEEIREVLGGPDLSEACDAMITRANERGGHDNITAIVAEVDGDGLPEPFAQETVTETLQILQEFGHVNVCNRQAPGAKPAPVLQAPVEPEPPPNRRSVLIAVSVGVALGLLAIVLWWVWSRT